MDTLSGFVERITYCNPENGYTVLRLRPEHEKGIHAIPKSSLSFDGLATVVGNLPEVSSGEFLQLQDNGAGIPHTARGSKQKSVNKPCLQSLPAFKAILDQE